jgi:hypothetical protein
MSPEVVARARTRHALGPAQRAGIARDLESHPDAILAGTLAALMNAGVWVEQETLLDEVAHLLD